MNFLVGFTMTFALLGEGLLFLETLQRRALRHFPHLESLSIRVGQTQLYLWGHQDLSERVHTMSDGSTLALVGSPVGEISWQTVEANMLKAESQPENFELPWDGRLILLRISADGSHWTMWNDWLGSIPVYHAEIGNERIVSTLEPVTVSGARLTPRDFFLPGLSSLLINGHFISDWTLYRQMKIVLPDSVAEWTDCGFRLKELGTVQPSQARWDTGWDDLVDEMHELSHSAIAEALKSQPRWALPLSAGLDSRLIAAVGADLGTNIQAYAWGEPNSTDATFSRQIAATLGIPWKHIELHEDFLARYTPRWAELFGSAMHFHGMYQMCFLDALKSESAHPIVTGYLGDVLSGSSLMQTGGGSLIYKKDWYLHWSIPELKALLKFPIDDALQEIADEVKKQADLIAGSPFQKSLFLELWSRQRLFTSFQSTLTSYWCWIATPFLNRAYARFCMSLPRGVHEDRRLLGDVFRRYYGRLAVIPGTYAKDPFIPTGSYLLKRRLAQKVPAVLHRGPLRGFTTGELRLDTRSMQATGRRALWPISEVQDQLSEWLDIQQLEGQYQLIMKSAEDIRPLRKLQSVQTLAYRLMDSRA